MSRLFLLFVVAFGACVATAVLQREQRPPKEWLQSKYTRKAIAVLAASQSVHGTVIFEQHHDKREVHIFGNVTGLAPNTQHGFHVHTFGDISNGCESAAAHFNPHNETHAGPADEIRHFGDLGNIQSDGQGNVQLNINDNRISLHSAGDIIGRMIVVHQNPDDLGRGGNAESKITGNAGPRIACGVIGRANTTISM